VTTSWKHPLVHLSIVLVPVVVVLVLDIPSREQIDR